MKGSTCLGHKYSCTKNFHDDVLLSFLLIWTSLETFHINRIHLCCTDSSLTIKVTQGNLHVEGRTFPTPSTPQWNFHQTAQTESMIVLNSNSAPTNLKKFRYTDTLYIFHTVCFVDVLSLYRLGYICGVRRGKTQISHNLL